MRYAGITDTGLVRKNNQDAYINLTNTNGDLLVLVCDGVGGNKAGEVAAAEVVAHFVEVFPPTAAFKNDKEVCTWLQYHLQLANKHIYDMGNSHQEYEGMGTTVTGLLFSSQGIWSLNVGDSRCYGVKDGKLIQLTQDDSLVAEMVRLGEITYEESLTHPKRHYVTKAIGIWESVESRVVPAEEMDQYLVCSDGLYGYVSDEEMLQVILSEETLSEKVIALRDAALQKGGYDNITLVLLDRHG